MARKRKKSKSSRSREAVQFVESAERYVYGRVGALPIQWELVALTILGLVLLLSLMAGYFQATPLFGRLAQVVEYSASVGDYEIAHKLLNSTGREVVLGTSEGLEEAINPEARLEEELAANSRLLIQYPDDRDLMIRQAELLEEIGDTESAKYFLELARVLDPNNPTLTE